MRKEPARAQTRRSSQCYLRVMIAREARARRARRRSRAANQRQQRVAVKPGTLRQARKRRRRQPAREPFVVVTRDASVPPRATPLFYPRQEARRSEEARCAHADERNKERHAPPPVEVQRRSARRREMLA